MTDILGTLVNTVLGGAIVAFIGYLGVKSTSKAQKESAEINAKGPEWSAFFKEVQDWTADQIKAQQQEIDHLRAEINEVREKLELWKTRYYIAIHYVRQLHLGFPEARAKFPVPDELEQDF
ncbi:hypothetical protein [Corynebacterium diphtheriae]|uniref:hypothetical protein n=1 Tax=Corynebacterium diphtheriae TaxID=1717 RepID=UPI0033493BEE